MSNINLKYRPEIDGLRAVAVLSVLFYHAKFSFDSHVYFQGGFIGVDIFFVISGYLISKIILTEYESEKGFSISRFYERRARRILPALFVVILISTPFAWAVLLPSDFVEYAKSLLSTIFFGSNFFFYFATTEYGTDSAFLKPFLHTWTLGIEEQFYLFFPLLFIFLQKRYSKWSLSILAALLFGSLLFSQYAYGKNEDLNFFLPISRFWELLVGTVVAHIELKYGRNTSRLMSQLLPALGFMMVAYAVIFFDKNTQHPGFVTMVPVLGVALIIFFSSHSEIVGKLLGSKLLVIIGLVSYSLYLWHFPIMAFSRAYFDEIDNIHRFIWVLVSLILSVISYYVVERPFRNRKMIGASILSVILLGLFVLIIGLSIMIIKNKGYEGRYEISGFLSNYELDNQKLRVLNADYLKSIGHENNKFNQDKVKVLIVGNSHARDIHNAFVLNQSQFDQFHFIRGPLKQIHCLDEKNESFNKTQSRFYAAGRYINSDIIIVSTRYKDGRCGMGKDVEKSHDYEGLKYLIKQATHDGKKVVVMSNNVEFRKIDKKIVADYMYNQLLNNLKNMSISEFIDAVNRKHYQLVDRKRLEAISRELINITNRSKAEYFDKYGLVCDDAKQSCTGITPEGYKAYWDFQHYTVEGSALFGSKLVDSDIKDLMLRMIQ